MTIAFTNKDSGGYTEEDHFGKKPLVLAMYIEEPLFKEPYGKKIPHQEVRKIKTSLVSVSGVGVGVGVRVP